MGGEASAIPNRIAGRKRDADFGNRASIELHANAIASNSNPRATALVGRRMNPSTIPNAAPSAKKEQPRQIRTR
jgi:hypothetical protein